jgi:glutamate-1-semialdehyde 2,1-aminomutase
MTHAVEHQVLPGGYGRSGYVVGPVAPRLQRGAGARVLDADGRWIIDANNNFAVLVLGHCDAAITDAAGQAMMAGVCYGLGHEMEERLALVLRDRLHGVEQVKFANSGTEAVMTALRLARGTTGRSKVLGITGAYHGSSDVALAIRGDRFARGVPAGVHQDVVTVPINDTAALRAAFAAHGAELAAVVLDLMPNYAGLVPLTTEFVTAAREGCDAAGAYLIFDEVISFRLRPAGLQSLYPARPDLTVLGKAIGGGFPIGAVAGSASAMEALNPLSAAPVDSSGTFTGNPASTAAGLACLGAFDERVIAQMNAAGDRLRRELAQLLPAVWEVRGQGSLVRVLAADPIDPTAAARALWWAAYDHGVLMMPTGLMALSAAMDDGTVDEIRDAVTAAAATVDAGG